MRKRIRGLEHEPRRQVTASSVRDEGVEDFGVVESVAFVLTGRSLHLFHVDGITARRPS